MSIGIALNNALSGLRVNQRSIAVLSNNIANANTDGYSRQVVDQSAVYVEGFGSGVRFDDVIRKVDKYLQRAVQENSSTMNTASVLSDYSSRVQVLLGEPGGSNTLDEYATTFFNALQALAETPERSSTRSNVVQSAETMAREMSQLATSLQDLRYEADQDMKDAVGVMNSFIKKLDNLNAAIGRSNALGQSTAGLLDERDAALRGLSEYMDISVFYNSDGQANVYLSNGAALVDGNRHEIKYTPLSSLDAFTDGDAFNALTVITLSHDGAQIGPPQSIISEGTSDKVTSVLAGGKLHGLQQVRDSVIPEILAELDMFASKMRDEMNRVHNMGTGYPAPTSLTGTRAVKAGDTSSWSGMVRIAVLTTEGQPITAGYPDESGTGFRPLTLDLSTLNSGKGTGQPSVQTIIDEINNHFGAPQIKTKLGAINDIQLASNTNLLPSGLPNLFNFDLDLENISNGAARVFVTNVTVRDDAAADITSVTNTAPTIAVSATNSLETFPGQDYFIVRTDAASGLKAGDSIYLPDPGGLPVTIGGIASSNFSGYFEVASVSGNDVTLRLAPLVFTNTAETLQIAGAQITPPYQTISGGANTRTTGSGTFTADLSASGASAYYDISVDVGVMDEDGNLTTSTITYRIDNNKNNLLNDRYVSIAATGDATRVLPYSSQEVMRAILVDEKGNEIQKLNGKYIDQAGYLKLITNNSSYTVAVDSLDSKQLGDPNATQLDTGTSRGFSHYFELNNFFVNNEPTKSGDTVKGSAINMAIEARIKTNPNLLATGKISASSQPADPDAQAQYTYVRNSGDNTYAQMLAGMSTQVVAFQPAGGLPGTTLSLLDYLGEFLGYIASQAAAADANYSNSETLYNGFKSRLDAVTGVNLDEELANTIIYQNAYTASAKIVKVADELYEELLGII